jgi:hypothetical protein
MTKVYAIVSQETPFQHYRIWGIATSRAKAEIACKTVKANFRAFDTERKAFIDRGCVLFSEEGEGS